LGDAVDLLDKYQEDVKIIAGGQSLLPLLKLRLASVQHLVDLRNVPNLSYIREEGAEIRIGAMTTHRAIEFSPIIRKNSPVLAEAAGQIGDPLIRNRGTIGGSLCHADPAADNPVVIVALDAKLIAHGKTNDRTIEAKDFFTDAFTTSLASSEILTEIRLPKLERNSAAVYEKLSRRQGDFAIVGITAFITITGKTCEEVRITLGGVAQTAIRSKAAEDALKGRTLTPTTIRNAAERAAEGLDPPSDIHAGGEYRLAMVEVVTRRALERCKQNLEEQQK
jgi:carbon-monoxide dehydrogenase medium subunit